MGIFYTHFSHLKLPVDFFNKLREDLLTKVTYACSVRIE